MSTENLQILAGALVPLVGQPVVVYLKEVMAEPIIGAFVPSEFPPAQPCPPYPMPAPAPPVAGGPSVTGGIPIAPGSPTGTPLLGPITGSPTGSTALWGGCEPAPAPMPMETAVVAGTLGFVGADYLILRVRVNAMCRDILIPFTAIGMLVTGCTA